MPSPSPRSALSLADSVRRILSTCGLSLADVSRASFRSENRLAHIPHTFYSSLRKQSFSPSLYQLHSLSLLSGYRLVDWLALFGFSLDHISYFQVYFPSLRTVQIDSTVYRPEIVAPGLSDLKEADFGAPLTPLSQWIALSAVRRTQPPSRRAERAFRYLKIGSHDALAYPDLLPGSIVRVKDDPSALRRIRSGKHTGRTLFLVRHSRSYTCSRLLRSGTDKIVLCSRQLPYAPHELAVDTEAEVVGTVDLEFRPIERFEKPVVSARLERHRQPGSPMQSPPPQNVGEYIQLARKSCGISFREAAARTRVIARTLGDPRYYCSPAALSDYETRKSAPRHVHKLISVCAAYVARFSELLDISGAPFHTGGDRPMPSDFLRNRGVVDHSANSSRFLREVERRFGPLPWFLRSAGHTLFRAASVSPRDLFWVGDMPEPKYSCIAGARLLIVDRRRKRPRASLSCPSWAQPIFVLQKRGGSHVWGFCRLDNGVLSLYAPAQHAKPLRLRSGVDAEVVGRVIGMIRSLGKPVASSRLRTGRVAG